VNGETFTLFYNGVFSQWHPSPFEVDGVRYSCAEQYMMAQKARTFGDGERLGKIMGSDDPGYQKAQGKLVRGYSDAVWHAVARDVVARASVAKFASTPALLAALMATGGTTLVEASPTDRVWGIGLGEDDPGARDRSRWRGRNWLGQVLTETRVRLGGR